MKGALQFTPPAPHNPLAPANSRSEAWDRGTRLAFVWAGARRFAPHDNLVRGTWAPGKLTLP